MRKTPLPHIAILVAFIFNTLGVPPQAQAQELLLPKPGVMIHLSPTYTPAYLAGLVVHPEDALKFDFLIQRGDDQLNESQKKQEYQKLIKYFLASLTVPDENQWVNLSPYEKDRMIKDDFGKTQMGRDLLGQDYLLKQITASLIYPQDELGKKFWDKVYERAYKEFGSTNIPVNTFNKVWIIPDEAAVYESGNTVYVLKNHLKVMLEEDYMSLSKHEKKVPVTNNHTIASQIIKEIILPELEKEVNEGQNFANLRQIYSGMILATWYKRSLKESLLGKVYANKAKVAGVNQDDPKANEAIYQQYLKAFKRGVFNYIKEDVDRYSKQEIPRKYFSGGCVKGYGDQAQIAVFNDMKSIPYQLRPDASRLTAMDMAQVVLNTKADQAMQATSIMTIEPEGSGIFRFSKRPILVLQLNDKDILTLALNKLTGEISLRSSRGDLNLSQDNLRIGGKVEVASNDDSIFLEIKYQEVGQVAQELKVTNLSMTEALNIEEIPMGFESSVRDSAMAAKEATIQSLKEEGYEINSRYIVDPGAPQTIEASVSHKGEKLNGSHIILQVYPLGDNQGVIRIKAFFPGFQESDKTFTGRGRSVLKFLLDQEKYHGYYLVTDPASPLRDSLVKFNDIHPQATPSAELKTLMSQLIRGSFGLTAIQRKTLFDSLTEASLFGQVPLAGLKEAQIEDQYNSFDIPTQQVEDPQFPRMIDEFQISDVPILKDLHLSGPIYAHQIKPRVYQDKTSGELFFAYSTEKNESGRIQRDVYQQAQEVGFDNFVEIRAVGDDYLTRIAQTYSDQQIKQTHASAEDLLLAMIFFGDWDHNPARSHNLYIRVIEGKTYYMLYDYSVSQMPGGINRALDFSTRLHIAESFTSLKLDKDHIAQRIEQLKNISEAQRNLLRAEVQAILAQVKTFTEAAEASQDKAMSADKMDTSPIQQIPIVALGNPIKSSSTELDTYVLIEGSVKSFIKLVPLGQLAPEELEMMLGNNGHRRFADQFLAPSQEISILYPDGISWGIKVKEVQPLVTYQSDTFGNIKGVTGGSLVAAYASPEAAKEMIDKYFDTLIAAVKSGYWPRDGKIFNFAATEGRLYRTFDPWTYTPAGLNGEFVDGIPSNYGGQLSNNHRFNLIILKDPKNPAPKEVLEHYIQRAQEVFGIDNQGLARVDYLSKIWNTQPLKDAAMSVSQLQKIDNALSRATVFLLDNKWTAAVTLTALTSGVTGWWFASPSLFWGGMVAGLSMYGIPWGQKKLFDGADYEILKDNDTLKIRGPDGNLIKGKNTFSDFSIDVALEHTLDDAQERMSKGERIDIQLPEGVNKKLLQERLSPAQRNQVQLRASYSRATRQFSIGLAAAVIGLGMANGGFILKNHAIEETQYILVSDQAKKDIRQGLPTDQARFDAYQYSVMEAVHAVFLNDGGSQPWAEQMISDALHHPNADYRNFIIGVMIHSAAGKANIMPDVRRRLTSSQAQQYMEYVSPMTNLTPYKNLQTHTEKIRSYVAFMADRPQEAVKVLAQHWEALNTADRESTRIDFNANNSKQWLKIFSQEEQENIKWILDQAGIKADQAMISEQPKPQMLSIEGLLKKFLDAVLADKNVNPEQKVNYLLKADQLWIKDDKGNFKLRWIVDELVKNAVLAQKEGSIELSLIRNDQNEIILSVANDGAIPWEALEEKALELAKQGLVYRQNADGAYIVRDSDYRMSPGEDTQVSEAQIQEAIKTDRNELLYMSGLTTKNIEGGRGLAAVRTFSATYQAKINIESQPNRTIITVTFPANGNLKFETSDKAMQAKGGIDLNSANLNLQIKRDGRGVPLPLVEQDMEQLKNIDGFVPVILDIKPAVDLGIFAELKGKVSV